MLAFLGNTMSVTFGDTQVARRGATERLVGILKVKTTKKYPIKSGRQTEPHL